MKHTPHPLHSRRAALAALGTGTLGLSAMLSSAAEPAPSAEPLQFNVRDFGARGDGKTDDTIAFESALAAAAQAPTGRCVRVPPGQYRLTRSLTLDSTLLIGLEAGGFPADTRPLPQLIVDVPAPQPCLMAKTGASVHGLELEFRRAKPDTVFGPGVKIEGGGVSLSNLLLHNPTLGIVADGRVNCGRVNLENIFMVNPAEIGVRFEYGLDVVTFRNVHVWNYVPTSVRTCTGFRIGHVDEIRLSDCSVVAAAIGFHFVETKLVEGKSGSVWGGMNNCTADFSAVAVQVDHASVLRVNGGSFWAHHFGLICNGPGDVIVSGADLRANSQHCIDVRGGATGTLTVTGCLLKKNATNAAQTAKLHINGPASVLVSGCQFDEKSAGALLGPEARRVSLTGNLFAASPHPALTDKTLATCEKLIANNLGVK